MKRFAAKGFPWPPPVLDVTPVIKEFPAANPLDPALKTLLMLLFNVLYSVFSILLFVYKILVLQFKILMKLPV